MNTKLILRTGWLFIICLLMYIFFVTFYLSPKVNNFLSETETINTKSQFNKVVSVIHSKIRTNNDIDSLKNELEFLLSTIILGKSGYMYIFDGKGNLIVDPSGEFFQKSLIK